MRRTLPLLAFASFAVAASSARAQPPDYGGARQALREARDAPEEDRARLLERAAARLIEAVNHAPDHEAAPGALLDAGAALESAGRPDSALRLYQRTIDEVGPLPPLSPEHARHLDSILGSAYFRTAFLRDRRREQTEALEAYLTIADSGRFARSSDPEMPARIATALFGAARLLEHLQDYRRASLYWERAAGRAEHAEERRLAHFRAGEMAFRARAWSASARLHRAFIARYRGDRAAAEGMVLAQWRISQTLEQDGRPAERRDALRDVVAAFDRSGLRPGSASAAYAARAQLALVEREVEEDGEFRLRPVRGRTVELGLRALAPPLERLESRAQRLVDRYQAVMAYRNPSTTHGALRGQARIDERLASAIRRVRLRGRPSEGLREAWSAALEERAGAAECRAVVRYVISARAARAASLPDAQSALERLDHYAPDRVARCVDERHRSNPSLTPYVAGELMVARPGRIPEDLGVAPPQLTE